MSIVTLGFLTGCFLAGYFSYDFMPKSENAA